MFKMLKRFGIANTERKLFHQLYKNEIAIIKKEDIQKESKIKKKVLDSDVHYCLYYLMLTLQRP